MNGGSPLGGARSRLVRLQSERLGRVVISGVLLLPLLVHVVARAVGLEIFYLADPKLQAIWGSLAQAVGGVPLYREAWLHLTRGGHGLSFWFALLSSLVYGVSLYTALVRPGTGVLFLGSALLILVAYLLDYLRARRS